MFIWFLFLLFLHFIDLVNRDAMSIAEQVSVERDAESCRKMPRSGIAGSYGRFICSFWRIILTDFQIAGFNLQFPQ